MLASCDHSHSCLLGQLHRPAHEVSAPRHLAHRAQHPPQHRQRHVAARAKKTDQQERPKEEQDAPPSTGPKEDRQDFDLDSVNPWSVGRRTRAAFDDAWKSFSKLGSPVSTSDPRLLRDEPREGQAPQAAYTRVLVIGATGSVGRVLVRKLLLRGYAVTAMVRSLEDTNLPQSVKLVQGDVTDYQSCRRALDGIDKVVYAAAAKGNLLDDHTAVSQNGVAIAAQAFQDFKNMQRGQAQAGSNGVAPSHHNLDTAKQVICKKGRFGAWRLEQVGQEQRQDPSPQASQSVDDPLRSGDDPSWGGALSAKALNKYAKSQRNVGRRKAPVQQDTADMYLNQRESLLFSGSLHQRGSKAVIGMELEPDAQGRWPLQDSEGLILRIGSNGSPFQLQLRTESGTYSHRFQSTPKGDFTNVRLPFNEFRPDSAELPRLNPGHVTHLAIRRDYRVADKDPSAPFSLELLRIKALPGGSEPDFILVTCAGTAQSPDLDAFENAQFTRVKRSGEDLLRQSGLGYVIVRPADLLKEPGGYKALIFDQANRITAGISAVDVADVCLRALHEPQARNKAFELCNEAPAAGTSAYELVAHLPDRTSNYLARALGSLEKNI